MQISDVFIKLFNMSLSASVLITVIILLRFLLKRAPKWILPVLWALAGVRLVCPISIKSSHSLMPVSEPVIKSISDNTVFLDSGFEVIDKPVNGIIDHSIDSSVTTQTAAGIDAILVLSIIWIIGAFIMLAFAAISYIRLRMRVAVSVPLEDNIRVCDNIESPFVLGILRPVIYLPSGVSESDIRHVLSHERAHLKRLDNLWKPLGYLLLIVYWFNPFIWIAFILFCKDIELACDEKVISDFKLHDKKAYATALLNLGMNRRMVLACPLAFGEVGVKERVKSVMNYKKPAFWIVIIAVVICAFVAVTFLSDPIIEKAENNSLPVEKEDDASLDEKNTGDITDDSYEHNLVEGKYIQVLFEDPHGDSEERYQVVVDANGNGIEETYTLTDLMYNGGDGGFSLSAEEDGQELELPKPVAGDTSPFLAKWSEDGVEILAEQPDGEMLSLGKIAADDVKDLYDKKSKNENYDFSSGLKDANWSQEMCSDAASGMVALGGCLYLKYYIQGLLGHADCFGYGLIRLSIAKEGYSVRYYFAPDIGGAITVPLSEYLSDDTGEILINGNPVETDYGRSFIYSKDDIANAMNVVMDEFMNWKGCVLHNIRYTSDDRNSLENINWVNELDPGKKYDQVIELLSDFHSPKDPDRSESAFNADSEYTDWHWYLARKNGGEWKLITYGY